MRRRPGHVLFLLFQIFWLNVVVPGHTRGAIPIEGSACAAERACCKTGKEPSAPVKTHGCAICSFAAQLSAPPAVVGGAPPLLLVARVAGERRESLVSLPLILAFDSRGPPRVA